METIITSIAAAALIIIGAGAFVGTHYAQKNNDTAALWSTAILAFFGILAAGMITGPVATPLVVAGVVAAYKGKQHEDRAAIHPYLRGSTR